MFNTLWAMKPEYDAQVLHALTRREEAVKIEAARGPANGKPPVIGSVTDGVAVVPVEGIIMKKRSFLHTLFGGFSTRELTAHLNGLKADPKVKSVVLHVDSPGGTVDGTLDLADAVADLGREKTVIAQVDGMAASAAYWVASQAHKIYMGRTDMVGSIGVRMGLYDWSKWFEDAGVEAVPIDTGTHKSTGFTGAPITEEQRDQLRHEVEKVFEVFVADVARGRRMDREAVTAVADGRMFIGTEAVQAGLADGIADLGTTVGMMGFEIRRRAAQARRVQLA